MDYLSHRTSTKEMSMFKVIGFIALFGLVVYGCHLSIESDHQRQIVLLENAYAEGQSDALGGDVRIKNVNDSLVVFVKSPWDNPNGDQKWETWRIRAIHVKRR